MNKKKLLISSIIMVIGVFLLVYSYRIPPEQVIVQVSFLGKATTTLPRILAILVPFILCIIGSLGYLLTKGNEQKYLLLAIIGLAVNMFTFVFNGVFKL